MQIGYANETNGRFDLQKEARIVGDSVVDALMYPKLVQAPLDDEAADIVERIFLTFRANTFLSAREEDLEDTKLKVKSMVAQIVRKLIEAAIIKEADYDLAADIAEEEILVRWSMESL